LQKTAKKAQDSGENVMKNYRIGEFARKVGVSPDFLKYQEEFAVIDPQQDKNSNYRHYQFSQAGRVYASLYYRNLGFSLREISKLLNDSSLEQIFADINARSEQIEEEIHRLQICQETIRDLNVASERFSMQNPWYIDILPSFAFLPHSHRYNFIEDERITSILADWTSWFPTVFSCQRILYKHAEKSEFSSPASVTPPPEGLDFYWGFMVDAIFADENGLSLQDPVLLIPNDRYLVYYQSLILEDTPILPSTTLDTILEKPLEVAQQNNLHIKGDIYHRILFHSHEDKQHALNSILYLPIA
jgi:DNA-binding transcriptional MerR regulator